MDVSPQAPTRLNFQYVVLSLILLAILDSLFTDIGIRQNLIQEANPLMKSLYDTSILGFYTLKISLPILLLSLFSKIQTKKYLKVLLSFTLLLYIFVVCLHIFWITLAIIT